MVVYTTLEKSPTILYTPELILPNFTFSFALKQMTIQIFNNYIYHTYIAAAFAVHF